MAITPFRARVATLAPGFLQDGSGERLLYCFGAAVDARLDRTVQATNAHMPTRAQADCQAVIGSDRLIGKGLTESAGSYGVRLQQSIDAWHFGGTSRSVLSQTLGYLLTFTPMVRIVWSEYRRLGPPPNYPGTWPPPLLSSSWDTYPEGRASTVEPVHVYAPLAGVNGIFNWDSLSPITGSWGSWSAYMILYSVGAQAWIGPAQAWGAGSTYTPAPSGYYSTVTAGAYVLAGSYTGTSQAFGAGSTYIPAASGYYSQVLAGAYALSGRYQGTSQAWGVDNTTDKGVSIQRIAKQFKLANTWIRALIVSFDSDLFSPSEPPGALNPDGRMGQWSKVFATFYTESRFASAVYGGEVV